MSMLHVTVAVEVKIVSHCILFVAMLRKISSFYRKEDVFAKYLWTIVKASLRQFSMF